mgnify:CR=1 FL=1
MNSEEKGREESEEETKALLSLALKEALSWLIKSEESFFEQEGSRKRDIRTKSDFFIGIFYHKPVFFSLPLVRESLTVFVRFIDCKGSMLLFSLR